MTDIYVKYPVGQDLTITDAEDAAGLIRISTASHNLVSGDEVFIKDLTDIPNSTGFWTINVISLTQVDLIGSVFSGTYVSGGIMRIGSWDIGTGGFRKLDLFQDETMEYISKVSDITQLNKVFSDFSNSFTVPSTPNNDEIFRYYYNEDIDEIFTYNPQIKVDCYIEIDTAPYRFGTIQLEDVKLKEGFVDSYSVGIFSNVTQITDLFGEDKLSDLCCPTDALPEDIFLGLEQYDYDNTPVNYIASIQDQNFQNGAIMTPMINMSSKKWQLRNPSIPNTNIQNITTTPFLSYDTRPALRIIHIIEAIEAKYKIKFSRDFFGRAEFLNLFMWLNRIEDFAASKFKKMDITQALTIVVGDGSTIALNSGSIDITYRNNIVITGPNSTNFGAAKITYFVNPQSGYTDIPYTVRISTASGKSIVSESVQGSTTHSMPFLAVLPTPQDIYRTETVTIEILSANPIPFDIDVNAFTEIIINTDGVTTTQPGSRREENSTNNSVNTLADIVVEDNIPDIKVTEFVQNIMKMFKLVIRPIRLNPNIEAEKNGVFLITTLNSFYINGDTIDLTDNIDFTDVTIKKPSIYKEIVYKYENTNNVLGKKYRELNAKDVGYGDLKDTKSLDQVNTSNKLEVSISWENMLFERLKSSSIDLTNFQIGESIKSDDGGLTFSKNKGKTLLFYNCGIVSINNSVPKVSYPTSPVTTYNLVYCNLVNTSNDMFVEQVSQSINFGSDIDSWHLVDIAPSLFQTKWKRWVDEIYDIKQRKYAFKAINLSSKIISDLDLSDTITIKDQKYKIDDFKVNLSTRDASLNLFKSTEDITQMPVTFTTVSLSGGTTFVNYSEDGETCVFFGDFTDVNGSPKRGLVKIDKVGNVINEFVVGFGFNTLDSGIRSIIRNGDYLYIGGSFTQYDDSIANRVVKIHYDTGEIDTTFTTNLGTGFNNAVTAICDTGDGIVVVGNYTTLRGVGINRVCKLNYNGTDFPGFSIGSGLNSTAVSVVKIPSGQLIITGNFTLYNGNVCSNIVKISNSGTYISSFGTGIVNTGTSFIGLETAEEDSYYIWVYGNFTSFNGTLVNKLFLLDGDLEVIAVQNGMWNGVDGSIAFGKRVMGNKFLIQRDSTGFTEYNGITTNSVILNTDGSVYYSFGTLEGFIYNIGDLFYMLKDNEVRFVLNERSQLLNREAIVSTPGQMYYGITIQDRLLWSAAKMDTGYGTGWVKFYNPDTSLADLDTTGGEGLDECTLLVANKTLETPPDVFNSRFMEIHFTFEDSSVRVVSITQQGLLDI